MIRHPINRFSVQCVRIPCMRVTHDGTTSCITQHKILVDLRVVRRNTASLTQGHYLEKLFLHLYFEESCSVDSCYFWLRYHDDILEIGEVFFFESSSPD